MSLCVRVWECGQQAAQSLWFVEVLVSLFGSFVTAQYISLCADILVCYTSTTDLSNTLSASSNKPTVGSFRYLGCRTDSRDARSLVGAYTHGPDVDLESCATYCASFEYFGTEFGQECFCSNTLATTSATADEEDCNMACAGDAQELCGAGDRLSVYKVGVPVKRSHWKRAE